MAKSGGVSSVLRKLVEQKVSDLPLQNIIEALPAAIYTTDANGRIELYNRAAVKLWGREPDCQDEHWCGSWKLYYPDGQPMQHHECPMAQALKSGREIVGAEAVAERPDGTRINFLAYPTPLRDEHGRIAGALNMLVDISSRKAMENELRRREAELTDFVENTTIGLHWVGPDGTILWANRAEMQLLGYDREEYIGRHIAEFHADRPVIDDILERLGRHEVLKDYEARMVCKDGTIKHVLIDSSVYVENGEFIHTRCFTRDITSEKRVETRLALGAEISQILSRSRTLAEAAPAVLDALSEHLHGDIAEIWLGEEKLRCAAFRSRLSGAALDHFKEFTAKLELGPGEGLPGRSWEAREPVWLEDVSGEPAFVREQVAEKLQIDSAIGVPILAGEVSLGAIICFVTRRLPQDQSLLNMLSSIGHKLGQFIIRTRGEEANRYLAAVVAASHDAVVTSDLDDIIRSWNPSAERIFGYTAEEAIGSHISIYVPEQADKARKRRLNRLLKGNTVEPFETVRMSKAGKIIPVSLSYSPVRNEDGQVVAAAAIVRDISKRKAAEAQLNARIKQLQAVSELGILALASNDLGSLFRHAVKELSEGLGVEYAKVLELQPDGERLLLKSGVGWQKGLVGNATVGADVTSQAGYTLSADQAVVVEDLREESRFNGPRLLIDHGVVSGLSTVIGGDDQTPYGVLGAHTRCKRNFNSHDVHFLQSVANILTTAIQKKRYQDRQVMLSRELSHRVKNNLAVIHAIAWQAGKQATSVEEFMESFEGRLSALAQAHDLLTSSEWEGTGLAALIEFVVGAHVSGDRLRINVDDLTLSAVATQAMTMVLHELMTNALKYGSLSNGKGAITLEGRRNLNGTNGSYHLVWRESGGPKVTEPTQIGFGSKLVSSTIRRQCGGEIEADWRPDGLEVRVTLPLAKIGEQHELQC